MIITGNNASTFVMEVIVVLETVVDFGMEMLHQERRTMDSQTMAAHVDLAINFKQMASVVSVTIADFLMTQLMLATTAVEVTTDLVEDTKAEEDIITIVLEDPVMTKERRLAINSEILETVTLETTANLVTKLVAKDKVTKAATMLLLSWW